MNENLKYKLTLEDLFTNRMNKAINSTSKLDRTINGVGNTMRGFFAGASIVSFGKSVIDSLKNYEYFSSSLRTLMHGDKNSASLLQSQLVELAKTSPFSLVDVQDSSKKLLAYGFAAGEVTKQMKMLGDISAATGNNIGDVAYLYGTLKTQGRAMTKDLYQFTNRGINVIPLLAKRFGILQSEVYKFAEQGKISFKDIEAAFTQMTSKGGDFFGMMDEQSKTVGGKLSNLGDSWEQLKVSIGQSQSGIIASTTEWITKMVNLMNKGLNNTNKSDAALEKFGSKNYSFMDYLTFYTGGDLFGKTRIGEDAITYGQLENLYTKGLNNKEEAKKSLKSLDEKIKGLINNKQYISEDTQGAQRYFAQLMGIREDLTGKIKAFESPNFNEGIVPPEDPFNGPGAKPKSDSEKSTEISGQRPQNVTINITKLVETQNITTQTLQESMLKIKEMVAKVLVETANDVNYITQ